MPREIITMQCGDCKERNYSKTKNRKTTPDRLEMKKFCRRCRKHTPNARVLRSDGRFARRAQFLRRQTVRRFRMTRVAGA
jgi:large subunit ribosomal protein L33